VLADWAPEMLVRVDGRRQTYGVCVDWWSFGCLLYEFLSGKCPFRTEAARSLDADKHKVRIAVFTSCRLSVEILRIVQSMDKATLHMEVPFDERYFSAHAKSLLQGLLTRDPTRRLGFRGASEIKVSK
jgi:serine/threonine protein kinase